MRFGPAVRRQRPGRCSAREQSCGADSAHADSGAARNGLALSPRVFGRQPWQALVMGMLIVATLALLQPPKGVAAETASAETVAAEAVAAAEVRASNAAITPLFRPERFWHAVLLGAVSLAIAGRTWAASRGARIEVRPIAGLAALEEAVGRATEMGRPMLFVPGIMDLNEIQTVAGLTVLSRVGALAAEYDTELEVPTARSLVMTAAREVVEAACLSVGRPEAFDADRIHYVTDEQFGYVAEVCGWMARERPAACFYLGQFFAESLLFAEAGQATGALQIAGTAEASQLPFFVAACDYTLLGEELFAASAYLSGEPSQLGSLQGQDWGKLLALILLGSGCLLATLAAVAPGLGPVEMCLAFLKQTILGQ